MDELTRERFGPKVSWVERRALLENPRVIAERRRILCGFDVDPDVETLAVLDRDRQLSDTIREWVA